MGKIYCSKCGTQIEDSASFCYKCGNKTESPSFENAVDTTIDQQQVKKKGNPFTKWIFIIVATQILLVILCGRPGFWGGAAFISALVLSVGVFTVSLLSVLKAKQYENRGKAVGIVFSTLSALLIAIVIVAIIFAGNNKNPDPQNDTGTPNTNSSTTSTTESQPKDTEVISTDWDSFECSYYENIPVGLLSTPDATSEIVTRFINAKTGKTGDYEVRQIYNAYQSCQMEISDVFSVYGCSGIARFIFDWNNTLYKIEFEFDDEGGIAPSTMSKIHDDISGIVGGKCSTNYLIDKGSSYLTHDAISGNTSCFCSWHLQEDLVCKARMDSYFNNGYAISNSFSFERTAYYNKTNYTAVADRADGSDSIVYGGVEIKGKYHSGSNPYISGTATNNSSKTVEFIKIKIALLDDSGNVINTTWTYAVGAEGLAPGETTQWTVYCTEAEDIKITIFN